MLVRALRLKSEIIEWTSDVYDSGQFAHLRLSDVEWEQVQYLVALLYPLLHMDRSIACIKRVDNLQSLDSLHKLV
jgi:hypothetical protein